MRLTITMDLDNAAFEDGEEVSRILRDLAADLEGFASTDGDCGPYPLMDLNGNKVHT